MSDMRMVRALRLVMAGLLVSITGAAVLAAEAYPSKPIRIVLGSAAGSGSDVVARALSTRLSENIGQAVVVDNRPGAAGLIGAEIAANAAPDGYTIFIATLTQHLSTTLQKRVHLEKAFEPIGLLATTPFMLVTSASVPAKTTEEFIAYAKARPGKLMFGSSGTGGSLHICVELFQSMAGLKMLHVPYKGSAMSITELIRGEIQLACPPVAAMAPFMENDKLRILGVTTKEPTGLAPGQPPIAKALPGYAFPGWYGALMPRKTPKHIVAKLHKEFARTLQVPEMRERLLKIGVEPAMSSPEEFRDFLNKESKRMETIFREAGVTAK
jgi:tripartite-type tricarboxylate transporter receptor subunit TctC